MRLLDVDAVLDREKDIQRADPNVEVLKEADSKSTSYAILSHRWGTEVSYEEIIGLMEMDDGKREKVRNRDGYKKIIKSCEKAMSDGHKFLWVDTCCINKQSSAELSEAINSMYQWYRDAQVCYAYLHDIDEPAFPAEPDYGKFNSSNGWPEWFLRGWTLQELIAPKEVQFFNKGWMCIGDKRNLAHKLERITQIPDRVLRGGLVSASSSVAQIMSWAADRKTTRVEDRAYSLLGLFGVSMPMLYGEGERAFRRLQLEIIRESNDCSIFAWDPYARVPRYGSVLADDPSYFRACRYIQKDLDTSFVDKLIMYIDKHKLGRLKNEAESRKDAKKLSVFLATNAGIQICLPVIPYSEPNPGPYEFRYLDSPRPTTLKAILACSDQHGDLITIDLTSRGSSFDRTLSDNELKRTSPEFMELYLTHHQVDEPACGLTLVDANASHYGFIRCGTFPREMTSNAFTLSSRASDLILIIYANYSAKSRFAVGLGKHFGREWMHFTCDECVANQQDDCKPWSSFAEKAYDMMWSARARLAQKYHSNKLHAHLSQSIWAAAVVWESDLVTVDIKKCAGCCVGPHEWTINRAFHSKLDGTSRQVWEDESAPMERRKQFEDIRKRFYTQVNMHQPTGTEVHRSHGNSQMADEAITSLSNMFGLKDLTNYVGEITFFKKLPLMVGTKPAGEGAAGVAEVPGDGLQSCAPKSSPGALVAIGNPSKLRQQSITIQDPRLEVALPLLLKECQTLGMWYRTSSRNFTTKQKIKHEARCISQTLGAGILQHISMAFTCGHLCIDYDGQLSTGSILQEINALQTKLDATENEAEQRVLEEDITGKILWFCWHGICLEVHELLSEVLNYIRKAGEVYGLLKIGQIIEQVMPDLNGDQAHLQRIMADARAGTSKHQLWLAATAPQHTNLRDKTISRDKPTRNTEETNLGTSSQMSPTSADL